MDFLDTGNLYTDLIKNQLVGIKEGESRHIEIDDRFNCFIYCVGGDKYTGWIYWVNGADAAMTFENLELKEIVYKAYDCGILSSFTEGNLYNEKSTNELAKYLDQVMEASSYNEANEAMPLGEVVSSMDTIVAPDAVPTGKYQSIHTEVIDGTVYIKISKSLEKMVTDAVAKAFPDLEKNKASDVAKIIISSCYRGSNV